MTDELKGYRIWKLDSKTKVPKEVRSGLLSDNNILDGLDWENETYAIRIGKKGLQ